MQTPTPVTFVALQTALAAAPRVLFRGKENQKLNWKVQEGFTVDSVEIWNNDEAIGRWQQDKGKTPIRKTGRGLQSKDESLQDTTIIALNGMHPSASTRLIIVQIRLTQSA